MQHWWIQTHFILRICLIRKQLQQKKDDALSTEMNYQYIHLNSFATKDRFSRINVCPQTKFTPPKSPSYGWMFVKTGVKSQSNLSNFKTKVFMFVFYFCPSREVFKFFNCRWSVIPGMFCIHGHWALRVLLRATPTIKWDIRFHGHLRG